MKRRYHLLAAVAVAALIFCLNLLVNGQTRLEETKPSGDITGYYSCKGIETGGKQYSGVCVIYRRGEVYLVTWTTSGGSFSGVGIRVGDTLSVGWSAPVEGKVLKGVNQYKLDGKTLNGRWATAPGNGQVQTETLVWLKDLDKEEDE